MHVEMRHLLAAVPPLVYDQPVAVVSHTFALRHLADG